MSEKEKITLKVTMEVTEAQALALQAMFEYWNSLADWGSSRYVGFMVDGDGNFHPKCVVETDSPICDLDNELRRIAMVKDDNGDRSYDFDGIAWRISKDYIPSDSVEWRPTDE